MRKKPKVMTHRKPSFLEKHKFLLVFSLIYLLLSVLTFDVHLFTGGDNVVYVVLAESIVSGQGYRNIHVAGEPEHAKFPIGFPLILSLLMVFFGRSFIVFKLFVLFTGLVSVYFMYKISECMLGRHAYRLMFAYITIPLLLEFNHWVLTEIPFLSLSLIAVYCVIQAEKGVKYMYYVAFIAVLFAFLMRTAGISLVVALLVFLLIKKKFSYVGIFLVLFLAAAIPWFLRSTRISEHGIYVEQFLLRNPYWLESGRIGVGDLFIRIWNNLINYVLVDMPETMLVLFRSAWAYGIVGFLFTVAALIGFVRRMKHMPFIALYSVFGLAIVLCWPHVWISARFLIPLLPFFIIYWYEGLLWFENAVRFRNLAFIIVIVIVVLNVAALVMRIEPAINGTIKHLKGEQYAGYPSDWRNYFEIIEWIDENIPDSAIVMARKPEYVYVISQNKTIGYPYTDDRAEIQRLVEHSDYVILDNFKWSIRSKHFLRPVIKEMVEHLEVIYKTDKPVFYLVKVRD